MAVIILSGNAIFGRHDCNTRRWPACPRVGLAFAHAAIAPSATRRPGSWLATLTAGLLVGIGLKLLMKSVVMPLLGADPINQAYRFLAGNTPQCFQLPRGRCWSRRFGEETVFRGYLFERLGKLFGPRGIPAGRRSFCCRPHSSAWLITPTRALAGVQQAAIVGLVFGTLFAITGRIWTVLFAHAAFDLTALALIYWNLESVVAHAIFK